MRIMLLRIHIFNIKLHLIDLLLKALVQRRSHLNDMSIKGIQADSLDKTV